MQRIMKNWIFTLVTCILLTILSVLMFLDGAGVGDLYIGRGIIHMLTAVSLLIYVVLALCPLVPKYHTRSGRTFLIGEIVILTVTAVAQVGIEVFNNIPVLSKLAVCSVLGLAVWLRSSVMIVRAYLVQGIVKPTEQADGAKEDQLAGEQAEETQQKKKKKTLRTLVRTPLWRLCTYILMGAIGVWQMVRPLIEDRYFVFAIAAVAGVFAIIFAVFTVQNHKALPPKPKKEKKAPAPKNEPSEPVELLPVLPAPAEEKASAEETAEDKGEGDKAEDPS
jgi:hypothetical protein